MKLANHTDGRCVTIVQPPRTHTLPQTKTEIHLNSRLVIGALIPGRHHNTKARSSTNTFHGLLVINLITTLFSLLLGDITLHLPPFMWLNILSLLLCRGKVLSSSVFPVFGKIICYYLVFPISEVKYICLYLYFSLFYG